MKAFPIYFKHPTTGMIVDNLGMDLRDYFAAQAMVKLMGDEDKEVTCKRAYKWADAMINQRKEVPNE